MNLRETVARIALALGLIALAVGIAACGSSDSSTATAGSTATTGDGGGGVSAAVSETVKKAMAPQTEFTGPTEPVAAESGKKIVAITCSSQGYGCVQGAKGVEEAGKELGWSVTVVDGKGDPSVWNEAIRQAIVSKADGIVLLAVDPKLVADGLSRAKAAGIPVIETFVPKFSGVQADGYVTTDHVEGGQILADWITQDSGGSGQVLMLNDNE